MVDLQHALNLNFLLVIILFLINRYHKVSNLFNRHMYFQKFMR